LKIVSISVNEFLNQSQFKLPTSQQSVLFFRLGWYCPIDGHDEFVKAWRWDTELVVLW